jgi:phospho-N-acetylmuramoyl-pentapeptide-transferase
VFSRQGFGQEIRVEGPKSHQTKRGTPSMGGVAIVAALWAGYWGAHLVGLLTDGSGPTASGVLILSLATTLALVGFLDDFIKIRKQRNLGLNKTAKSVCNSGTKPVTRPRAPSSRTCATSTPSR